MSYKEELYSAKQDGDTLGQGDVLRTNVADVLSGFEVKSRSDDEAEGQDHDHALLLESRLVNKDADEQDDDEELGPDEIEQDDSSQSDAEEQDGEEQGSQSDPDEPLVGEDLDYQLAKEIRATETDVESVDLLPPPPPMADASTKFSELPATYPCIPGGYVFFNVCPSRGEDKFIYELRSETDLPDEFSLTSMQNR